MTSGSPSELIIDYVVMLLTSSGTEQDLLHHQWACYKKEAWRYITSRLFNGI